MGALNLSASLAFAIWVQLAATVAINVGVGGICSISTAIRIQLIRVVIRVLVCAFAT